VLEGLEPGARIRVLTDDPRSARDLPGAAEAEGYAVLEIEHAGATAAILIER
jgi:TusA-related sulfurtransferase